MNTDMEELNFNSLVDAWQNDDTTHLPDKQKSNDELLLMTKQKADTIFTKLFRNFWIEIAFGASFCALILPCLLLKFGAAAGWLLFACVFVSSVVFYVVLGRILYGSRIEAIGIHQSIKASVDRLESFERTYYMLLVAVCCVAFVCIRVVLGTENREWKPVSFNDVIRFFLMLVVLAAAYYPTTKLLRQLYGKYIKRLNDCLNEIES